MTCLLRTTHVTYVTHDVILLINKMLSKEDRALIKVLRVENRYGAKRIITKFPGRNFSLASVKRLLHQIDTTGSADRKSGSGRRRTARCGTNVELVEDLAFSQEDAPGTHRTVRQIARETGITKSSVHSIMRHDLKLKCFKKKRAQDLTEAHKNKCLVCATAKRLLRRYPEHEVPFRWFTDEKQFTVAPPVSRQNDRLYTSQPGSERNNCQPTGFCVNVQHFPGQ